MAKQNQNRKQTPDPNSVFKFTGIAMNRDGEPIVLTECGKVFRVYRSTPPGSPSFVTEPTWLKIADHAEDDTDDDHD